MTTYGFAHATKAGVGVERSSGGSRGGADLAGGALARRPRPASGGRGGTCEVEEGVEGALGESLGLGPPGAGWMEL